MLKEFLRDKSVAQLMMIGATLLLLVSQFFEYYDETGSLIVGSSGETIQVTIRDGQPGTGWELHPQAYAILVVFGFVFLRDDIVSHPLFKRFGWWLSVALTIWATFPGAYLRTPGAEMGAVAILISVAAAVIAWLSSRSDKTEAAAPKRKARGRERVPAAPKF